ncbi:hypothetical protein ODJ79_14645 [Actinoplanes sp. KI2]|uniref:hypothetical protein n=1 Tax=Actinoplanes sp. KI2 TaxID=2983315 RepID=UPI0021D589B2|nr:hypothetical protein [Actinoplanes sp. KI2]MCU7724962.1 hypothetical protein [Actinoplanes sp. KI2]
MTNRKTILCLTAVLLTGGCSGAKTSGPQVASVPGATTATVRPSASDSAADRQLPLGATQEQIDRAYAAYYACWTAHGVPSTKSGGEDGGPLLTYKLNQKKYQPAVDACADREPLNPPELDPQQNPDYWDQLRDEQRCVQAKGLPLQVVPGQQGLWVRPATDANYRKVRSDAAVQIQRDCEIQAYTKK